MKNRTEKANVSKTAVEIELQTTKKNLMASVMSLQRENYNINSKYNIIILVCIYLVSNIYREITKI